MTKRPDPTLDDLNAVYHLAYRDTCREGWWCEDLAEMTRRQP